MKFDNIGSVEYLLTIGVLYSNAVPQIRFFESLSQLFGRDADVGDMESHLSEIGTGEDESQVSVDRDRRVFRSLGEKMISTLMISSSLDGVSEASSK